MPPCLFRPHYCIAMHNLCPHHPAQNCCTCHSSFIWNSIALLDLGSQIQAFLFLAQLHEPRNKGVLNIQPAKGVGVVGGGKGNSEGS